MRSCDSNPPPAISPVTITLYVCRELISLSVNTNDLTNVCLTFLALTAHFLPRALVLEQRLRALNDPNLLSQTSPTVEDGATSVHM